MAHVAALYRYPVKGFTPESAERLAISAESRVLGDRVLGLRLGDNDAAADAWSPKAGMLVLMNTPGLARLHLHFDDQARRLRISLDGAVLVDESIDGPGRERIAAAVGEYASTLAESPLVGRPERLPLRLVGDGVTPRFSDNPAGLVTLHGRASLAALAEALEDPDVSEVRFRSNIAVEGLEAWEELSWAGVVRIGGMRFAADHPNVRCLATHANPETGERDRDVMTTLTRAFAQERPTFAVQLRALDAGEVRLGDAVEVAPS